jgi:hypothetical protein
LVAFADYAQARVTLLDPARRRVVTVIPVDGNPTGLTWDGHRLWYCDYATAHLRAVEVAGLVDPV